MRGDYTRTLALTRLLLLLAPLRAFVAPAFVAGRDLVFFFFTFASFSPGGTWF